MKWHKIIVLTGLCLSLSMTSCFLASKGSKGTLSLFSSDGGTQITLPSGWSQLKDLNDKAELQAGNMLQEMYLIVLTEAKEDFVDMTRKKHSEMTRSILIQSLTSPEMVGPSEIKVGGNPAVQYEIRGVMNNIKVTYLHTTVESPKNFHQVLAWTLRSRFTKNETTLQRAIASFREKPTPSATAKAPALDPAPQKVK